MFEQMKKNTVAATNQLKESEFVRFENPSGKGIRVMFAGNSITLHGIKKEIGWEHEWGMAASAKEKDYVHMLMSKIKECDEDAVFCICQVAQWERSYKKGTDTYKYFETAREFNADIIIGRFIENCAAADFDSECFKKEYDEFIKYLNAANGRVILTTGFWKHPGDDMIKKLADENGYPLAELGDLGELDEMKAIGLFEHDGVAAHPGDKGMKAIAERIWEKMKL